MTRTPWLILAAAALATLCSAPAAFGEDFAYVGSKNCKKCHIKEFRSWESTKMAQAFDLLKPGERADEKTAAGLDPSKDYTSDPECVRCHVTGLGQPGGFVSLAETPDLAGVGCEVCHGPGGTYTLDEHMSLKNREYKKADVVAVGMVDTVSAAQCTSCHNAESPFVADDHVFDYEANKDQGTHEKIPLKYEH